MHRLLLIFFFLIVNSVSAQKLNEVRQLYPLAHDSEEVMEDLEKMLTSVSKNSNAVLMAYKGAVWALKAEYAKKLKDKKTFFKTGADFLETAVAHAPKEIEVRYLRLTVQENAPRIVGYHKDIEEDKAFILAHFSEAAPTLQKILVDFAQASKHFKEEDRQRLKLN